jgi:hypothetical protein
LDAHVLGDNEANLDAAFEAFSECFLELGTSI